MNAYRAVCLFGLFPLLLSVAGCAEPTDPRIAELQKKFLLADAPEGARTVSSIRKELLPTEGSPAPPSSIDVVIQGRVNAGDLPPWETGKTAFVLTDATGHVEGNAHDPHTCPYCSRTIEDYLVQVSFRDEADKLFEIDSRKAFGLKEQQLLVIKGSATLDDDLLKVDATGLHICKPEASEPEPAE